MTIPTLEQHLAAHRIRIPIRGLGLDRTRVGCSCNEWEVSIVNRHATSQALHDAHVAAAWREARTVRTVEELDALGREAIVMWINQDGSVHGAHTYPDNRMLRQIMTETDTTALILWTPEGGAV
ncbi:hypothetical protein [Gordonia malaquae]|uniref:hypothetical protein n=1 Tax=Gordonia malaquae TaxID=410332 RepID=UPI0030FF2B70